MGTLCFNLTLDDNFCTKKQIAALVVNHLLAARDLMGTEAVGVTNAWVHCFGKKISIQTYPEALLKL